MDLYQENLIKVFEQIGCKLDNGEQIDVIYLDMSKAFDKVSHAKLLQQLSKIRVPRKHLELVLIVSQ